ncbi:SpoIID/LytB domain-containing protein [uncultured Pseudokineococcus sp.]|uniref:SpoIID/LytB domain-containing protein n=1 Tax=uncultured Pseudokineococcus sp. TaxID=1642928 RepID=UPI0026288E96|nr:SpoIID/LytB domain-containing protein [uncultured Pseudokineococcus sp.]
MTSRPTASTTRRALAALVAVAATGLGGLLGPPSGVVAATAASAAGVCPAAGGAVVPAAAAPAGAPDVVLDGHGWGHGMGMSQYGARGAALLGCSSTTILTTYYPGLVPARRSVRPTVLVDLLTGGGATSRAEVRADDGPVRWSSGTQEVVQPQGATWTVRRAAGDRLEVLAGTDAGAVAPRGFAPTAGALVRAENGGREVRVSTWASSGATPLVRRSDADATRFAPRRSGLEVRAVLVDGDRGSAVDTYLRGLAEMPVSWPQAAQEAQVVAARTFLLGKYVASEDAYVVRPTTADQVWTGAERRAEDARYGGGLARAVAATSTRSGGTVMTTPSGALARDLLYASSHGGWSETNTYVWGSAPVAHLRQVDDSRWELASGDPNASWSVGLTWAEVARAFGLSTATDLQVAPRGSADRTEVVVVGTRAGAPVTLRVTGQRARDALRAVSPSVRSSGFTVRRSAGPVCLPGATNG